jgi:hypothetical protein
MQPANEREREEGMLLTQLKPQVAIGCSGRCSGMRLYEWNGSMTMWVGLAPFLKSMV